MSCHDDHQLIDFYAYNMDGTHFSKRFLTCPMINIAQKTNEI